MWYLFRIRTKVIYSWNAGDVHWCVNVKKTKGVSCPSNVYKVVRISEDKYITHNLTEHLVT